MKYPSNIDVMFIIRHSLHLHAPDVSATDDDWRIAAAAASLDNIRSFIALLIRHITEIRTAHKCARSTSSHAGAAKQFTAPGQSEWARAAPALETAQSTGRRRCDAARANHKCFAQCSTASNETVAIEIGTNARTREYSTEFDGQGDDSRGQ